MAQHSNYWSCSPFADWIRGTNKLNAGTSDEWHHWRLDAESNHPFRYWLAEEALDTVQDFVTWPVRKIYDVKYYINNRWITRTHALTSHPRDIQPGAWSDVGNRFLPCLFNELVNYVEIELAWSYILWNDEARKRFRPPFWAHGWWRIRTWRCPEAGIEQLKNDASTVLDESWGITVDDDKYGKPTQQAINALEVAKLYDWWTKERPARPDPYDASGWSEYCEKVRELNDGQLFGSKKTPELERMSKKSINLLHKMEKQYEKEDTDMLIRLIKIRNSLWT